MIQPTRQIFRTPALTHYQKKQQQVQLPFVFSPLMLLYTWGVLCLFIGAELVTLLSTVPVYTTGIGVVLATPDTSTNHANTNYTDTDQARILLLVGATQAEHLKHNTTLQIEVQAAATSFVSTLHIFDTTVLDANTIQKRYAVTSTLLQQPITPSIALIIPIPANQADQLNAGQLIHAHVLVGQRTLFSLLQGDA